MNDVLETTPLPRAPCTRTLFGRRRMVPDIRSENRARRLAAERIIAMNTPIQGTAADLLKLAMLAMTIPPEAGGEDGADGARRARLRGTRGRGVEQASASIRTSKWSPCTRWPCRW